MIVLEDEYPCVGICMVDENGYCQGCGRPQSFESPLTRQDENTPVEGSPIAKSGADVDDEKKTV